MKDTLTVELTEEEVAFLRQLLFAYDDNAQSLDEMYLNLIEKIDFNDQDPIPFEPGDTVCVIASSGKFITHYFAIGDILDVLKVDEEDASLYAMNQNGLSQWIHISEVEKVEKTK